MAWILFETELNKINSIRIIKVPIHLSAKLPSCGMVMATVTLKTVTLKAMKFQVALEASNLHSRWAEITTKARWDWIRWIRSTANPKTRQHRIEVTCSKLASDKNRPCCFDRSRCTVLEVSKNGVLAHAHSNNQSSKLICLIPL